MKIEKSLYIGLMMMCCCLITAVEVKAQSRAITDVPVRYVKVEGGNYSNDGTSWANAKNNLQDAINALHTYMSNQGLREGHIYVAADTYTPDESTEAAGGNIYHSSFKIYEGIKIFGGFPANITDASPMTPDERPVNYTAADGTTHTTTIDQCQSLHIDSWNMAHPTILDGNQSSAATTFEWNEGRGRFDTSYPGNSYHVVWFATNGFFDDNNFPGYARPLSLETVLDGFIIQNGYASNKNVSLREHTSYGGGAYMVKNAVLRNCIVQQCASTRRGGGVYMDGGGLIDHCLITNCQSPGLGIRDGYGGGVCGDYGGSVSQSVIDHCLARFGGGLALCYEALSTINGNTTTLSYPAEYSGNDFDRLYKPYAAGVVVSNNTSTSEAGGVALIQGGTLNHCTIVNNNCVGIDVSYDGRRYGRTGGLYIDMGADVYNSALWGNTCAINSDIQYAAYVNKNQSDPRVIAGFSPSLYHVGMTHHDRTNWNGTSKDNVFSLETKNVRPNDALQANTSFVYFRNPTTKTGAGATEEDKQYNTRGEVYGGEDLDPYHNVTMPIDWTPRGLSSLNERGIQVIEGATDLQLAHLPHISIDRLGYEFEPVSTLGALVEAKETKGHFMMDPIEPLPSGRSYTQIPTIFVDPNRRLAGDHPALEVVGGSWTLPLDNISKAIQYFKEHSSNQENYEGNTDILGADEYYTWDNGTTKYYEVQILVKEGMVNTAGPSSYDGDYLRTASIRPESNMRLYGGYPSKLTERNTQQTIDDVTYKRNPKLYPTRITADITEGGYEKNSIHVVSLTNTANAIIDGFQLYYGRAQGGLGQSVSNGGGVIVSNALTGITHSNAATQETIRESRRVPMTGNILRNSIIANCSTNEADNPDHTHDIGEGSAIYVNGVYTAAQLTVENCIIHNNTAPATSGTVTVYEPNGGTDGDAWIKMDHCGIFNNVGYALKTLGTGAPAIECNNTAIYANYATALTDRTNIADDLSKLLISTGSRITGQYNIIDDSQDEATNTANLNGFTNSTAKFTYSSSDNPNYTYPSFINPTRNVGHSEDADQSMYGDTPDWTPLNINPMTNTADPTEDGSKTDLTCEETRNRGGVADVGALENTSQPKNGAIVYVTPDGAGRKDGSSWSNAIAGNYIYKVGNTYITEANGTTLVPTTDSRYQGGRYEDDNTLYPYGEKSNFSKDFWESNRRGNSQTGANSTIVIDNNRDEDYVSGLQFAVEKAAALNADMDEDANFVRVWVGNGTYTDHKGYIMRNKTQVYGGFPASTIANPAEGERIALMAEGIPVSSKYEGKTTADYETVIQVSSTNSKVGQVNLDIPDGYTIRNNKVYQIIATSTTKNGYGLSGRAGGGSDVSVEQTPDATDEYQLWALLDDGTGRTYLYNVGTKKIIVYSHGYIAQFVDISTTTNTAFSITSEGYIQRYGDLRCFGLDGANVGVWTDKKDGNRATWNFVEVRNTETSDFSGWSDAFNSALRTFSGSGTTIVRKPVLAQPDVCLPTWSPNNTTGNSDAVSNTYRYPGGQNAVVSPSYQEYTKVVWDGFTIRHGYYNTYNGNRDGGAGVRMFRGVDIMNCVIRDNYNAGVRTRGGGVYMDGENSRIISCFVFNNIVTHSGGEGYGGGGYLIIGTAYNSLFALNSCDNGSHDGSGIFLEGALFYNNTIAYNKGTGISHWTDNGQRKTYMEMYNCILWGNTGTNDVTSSAAGNLEAGNFKNNYIQKNGVGSNKIIAANNNLIGSAASANPFAAGSDAPALLDFRLNTNSVCVNAGEDTPVNYNGTKTVTLPPNDVSFTDRIQDCTVDIGAYEYNGAPDISPTVEGNVSTYYVTQNGRGVSSGQSPATAACMQKLQKVLDAAGRYKYDHPEKQVIVKLAKIPQGGYYPLRTSIPYKVEEESPRSFSFIIPRGVEVWGGYTDDYTNDSDHGFLEVNRDIIGNKTILNGVYNSSSGQEVKVYHVFTFTDYVYNEDGKVAKRNAEDNGWEDANENTLGDATLMSSQTNDRAVLDGLFIEGGNANGMGLNENDQRGGGGVVTGYSHLRNCIVQNNNAMKYGGGLYLENNALVSGSIIQNNTAERGAGIYVFEPKNAQDQSIANENTYAYLISSTIVKNTATTTGGGIKFENNLRANSSVFWMNEANDEQDVSGIIDTGLDQHVENYPLNYCAVKSLRASGVSNVEVDGNSDRGVRWVTDNNQSGSNYYNILRSSALGRTGMTYENWSQMHTKFPSLETKDLAGITRGAYTAPSEGDPESVTVSGRDITLVTKDNAYIEIGARALNYMFQINVSDDNLMTRLFVTHSADLNTEASEFLKSDYNKVEYYRQIGSCFANPMQRLSDAFEYIVEARKQKDAGGNYVNKDKRFEVFIASGTYFPYMAADGTQDHARAATFLIPEGVTVLGGNSALRDNEGNYILNQFFCQETTEEEFATSEKITDSEGNIPGRHYYKEDVTDMVVKDVYTGEPTGNTISLVAYTTEEIKENRENDDLNQNGIIAPWELKNQTFLSGQTVSEDVQGNVYHIVTCLADKNLVGGLPTMYSDDACTTTTTNRDEESLASKARRAIILDGVTLTEGAAMGYEEGNMLNANCFYRGGAIMVDGSWDNTPYDEDTKTFSPLDMNYPDNVEDPNELGKRDIPLVINDSQFINNKANFGGAIFSNGTVRIFSSNFVQNETDGPSVAAAQSLVRYSGGGAVAANGDFMAVNSIFANNQASKSTGMDIIPEPGKNDNRNATVNDVENYVTHGTTISNVNLNGADLQGYGGVLWGGTKSRLRVLNCDLVRNMSIRYPAVFNMVPNHTNPINKLVHYGVNSIFWGNERADGKDGSLMNFGVNVDNMSLTEAEEQGLVAEAILFSAYPAGRGLTAKTNVKGDNTDYRAMPFDDSPLRGYFQRRNDDDVFLDKDGDVIQAGVTRFENLTEENKAKVVQYNHNVILNKDNNAIDGPNFVYPSSIAGIAGYMPSADWQLLRVNNLVDQGWTMMTQEIDKEFVLEDENDPETATGEIKYSTRFLDEDMTDDDDSDADAKTRGIYKYHARRENEYFESGGEPLIVMDMGTKWSTIDHTGAKHTHDTPYMKYTANNQEVYRISPNEDYAAENFKDVKTYIDIGVYEYQHLHLVQDKASDLDVIWVVAPLEGKNITSATADGTRDNPYPNLQTAIVDLLRHRNNHPKLIKLGQGEYTPVTIDVRNDNDGIVLHMPTCTGDKVTVDDSKSPIYWGIESLTIRGGYKVDPAGHGVEECDPDKYPSIIRSMTEGNARNQQVLINIIDAENKKTNFSTTSGGTLSLHSDGQPIPIILENLHFFTDQAVVELGENEDDFAKVQPSVIHYKPQYVTQWNESTQRYEKSTTELLYALDGGKPKLVIKNCRFNKCTDRDNRGVTTVGIEGGGGESLIVNTVFHHSSGRPLTALNTKVINCTFAKNGKHLRLVSSTEKAADKITDVTYQSELHNSVVWLDDQIFDSDQQDYELMTTTNPAQTYNATSVETTTSINDSYNNFVTHNAFSRLITRNEIRKNDALNEDNSNLMEGPNFAAPDEWDPEQGKYGDYSILPNILLMSQADENIYKDKVGGHYIYTDILATVAGYCENYSPAANPADDQVLMKQGDKLATWNSSNDARQAEDEYICKLFTNEYTIANDLDAAGHHRLVHQLDRGAYECHAAMNRVAYVKPGSYKPEQDGTSWHNAYGHGELQKALNAAAVYHRTVDHDQNKTAYVFVQGGGTNEDITLREGVQVWGSIPTGTYDQVAKEGDDYTDAEIAEYLDKLREIRTGLVGTATTRTLVSGIEGNLNYGHGPLLDGFEVTSATSRTTPAVNITSPEGLVVVRNVLVHDNNVTGGEPVVKLTGGLLYNALIRDNTTDNNAAIVDIGDDGRMLNCTVVAAAEGQKTVKSGVANGAINSIAYNTFSRTAMTEDATGGNGFHNCYNVPTEMPSADYTWHTFAPYMRDEALSYNGFYGTVNRNLWYQLHEYSINMNIGTNDTGTGSCKDLLATQDQKDAVDFEKDLDVLGNPRLIAGQVDRGCFETCHVKATDGVVVIDKQLNNHAGQYYPHPGSVFYLLDNATCVMRKGDFRIMPLQLGYLLMKPGASLYVNGELDVNNEPGNRLLLSHMAVEKTFNGQYHLISMPFETVLDYTSAPHFEVGKDFLTRNEDVNFTPYSYDGEQRSQWHGFRFKTDESDCWKPITDASIAANHGWLMDRGSGASDNAIIRFSAIGQNAADFVYLEGESDKEVILTQYDDRKSNNGDASFTKLENMGWNLVGMPYLVSDYDTFAKNAEGAYDAMSDDYEMNVPHVTYSINPNGTYMTASQSWANGSKVSLGNGFFTQTAVLGEQEELIFKMPQYTVSAPSPARQMMTISRTGTNTRGEESLVVDDRIEVRPSAEAEGLDYHFGSDGVKWAAFNDQLAQLYIISNAGIPLGLMAQAPVETEIPLGVSTPEGGSYTISLPEPEAYEEQSAVWVIDKVTGASANLLEEDFVLTVSEGGTLEDRLVLKFGGKKPGIESRRSEDRYHIFARQRILHIEGLTTGDDITVYTPGGALYRHDTATGSTWQTPVYQGVYLVRINGITKKVISR